MSFGNTCVGIETECPFCGDRKIIRVRKKDYIAWQDGALIQRAFPYLTANERERLSTGICPSCWDKICGLAGEE